MTRAELLRACFGSADLATGEAVEIAYDDDVLSHLDLLRREVTVAGERVEVAGIANVCTEPAWRGRRLASTLIEYAHLIAARENGLEYAALFSDYREFYRRFGYQHPDGAGATPFLVVELAAKPWPGGAIDVGSGW